MNTSVSIIGAGRLATHLAVALAGKGIIIPQVFSRQLSKASTLAQKVNAEAINDLKAVNDKSDLYIIAVSDDAIYEVAHQLQHVISSDKLVVHTSGAAPSTLLAPFFQNYGVFYPLQSFSLDKAVDFRHVPIGVYSPIRQNEKLLFDLGSLISQQVQRIDDHQRAKLHLAAVFVNNFTNYLFHIGYDITNKANLPFSLLMPLIEQTVEKIKLSPPVDMQTGPARRGDHSTIQRHLSQLEVEDYKSLYELITKQILQLYHKK